MQEAHVPAKALLAAKFTCLRPVLVKTISLWARVKVLSSVIFLPGKTIILQGEFVLKRLPEE